MSYDLAVWEGDRPVDDKSARRILEDLYDRYLGGEIEVGPSKRIIAFVDALLERWPDVTTSEGGMSPWSVGPLIAGASGPVIYFGMAWARAEEASSYAVAVADSMGLVCFDVQEARIRNRAH
ncbi:hypothetical protein ACFYPT_38545 [Streptomyces sp. NPDC005529]|uniref:hypothetical protein n=1 Tax=unclassified Streptomyces TaxID=2593676 RepID=UPI00339F12B9